MPSPTDRARLLHDLTESRWEIMRWLADEAEERGDGWEAAGWRWLAERKKWPAGRDAPPIAWPVATGRPPNRLAYVWTRAPTSLTHMLDQLPGGAYVIYEKACGAGRADDTTIQGALLLAARAVGTWLATSGKKSKEATRIHPF